MTAEVATAPAEPPPARLARPRRGLVPERLRHRSLLLGLWSWARCC